MFAKNTICFNCRFSADSKTDVPKAGGFVLSEMLLVTVLILIIFGLAVPNFSGSFSQMPARNTAEDLAYSMRYAQSRAIARGQPVRLILAENKDSYYLAEQIQDKKGISEFQRVSGSWGRNVVVPDGMPLEATNPYFDFYPDGKIEKGEVKICRKDNCWIVSTKLLRGQVELWEETAEE